jgi:hypothetical protein
MADDVQPRQPQSSDPLPRTSGAGDREHAADESGVVGHLSEPGSVTARVSQPSRRGSTARARRRQMPAVAAVALLVIAAVLTVWGYRWTRPAAFPSLPSNCPQTIASCRDPWHTATSRAESAITVYVSNPSTPVAVFADFGDNAESINIGADVPAHQRLNWILQLSGTAMINHPTHDAWKPQDVWVNKEYGQGVSLGSRVIKKDGVQYVEGSILGPTTGYSVMRAVGRTPEFSYANNGASIYGSPVAPSIASTGAYKLGNLPFLIAHLPGELPGTTSAVAGEKADSPPLPGRWFNPKVAFLRESVIADTTTYDLTWANPAATDTGTMLWVSASAIAAQFEERSIRYQATHQDRQFYAGILLGIAGGAWIGGLQGILVLGWRRRGRPTDGVAHTTRSPPARRLSSLIERLRATKHVDGQRQSGTASGPVDETPAQPDGS